MKQKIESNFNFDERRKILKHKVIETRSTEGNDGQEGDVKITTESSFNEKGINAAIEFVQSQINTINKDMIILDLDNSKEFQEFQKNMDQLNRIKELKKQGVTKESANETLKKHKQSMKELKDAIGSRLNLGKKK